MTGIVHAPIGERRPFYVVWRPLVPHLDPVDVARFVARVDISAGLHGCWPWQGGLSMGGYGRTLRYGVNVGAHRFALEIKRGRPLGDGMFACHTCDAKSCVNPGHLYEGTPADNNRDTRERVVFRRRRPSVARSPETILRGVRHPRSKLTEADVAAIRSAPRTMSNVAIGMAHGVDNSTISKIRASKTWTHVR
jgi:hypothetical protein